MINQSKEPEGLVSEVQIKKELKKESYLEEAEDQEEVSAFVSKYIYICDQTPRPTGVFQAYKKRTISRAGSFRTSSIYALVRL